MHLTSPRPTYSQRKELIDALEEVHDENKLLHEQLEKAQASSRQKNAELDQIMKECHELEFAIAEDNRRQASAREEAGRLKRQANDLKDELTAAEWKLEELEALEESLRVQIVSSPDRRRKEMIGIREQVAQEKKENVSLEENMQQSQCKISNLQKGEKNLTATITRLGELFCSAQKYMTLVRSVEENKARKKDLERKAGQLEREIQEADRRVHRANEKILAQRKQHVLQREATQEALDTEKSRILVLEKQRREDMIRIQQGEKEVMSLRTAMEAERSKTEREIQEMVAKYNKHELAFLQLDRSRLKEVGVKVDA